MKQLFISLIALILVTQPLLSQDESYWRGPDRNGIYPDKDLLKTWPENGPQLSWDYTDLGKGFSCPAFANDKIYITGTPDSISYVYALNHKGELLWKTELGLEWMVNFPGTRSTPKIIKDRGYLLSGLGVLTCFDANKGGKVWEIDLIKKYEAVNIRFGMTECLLIEDDILYCTPGGEENNILALNRHNGDLIWTSKAKGEFSAHCSPISFMHGGKKYITTVTGQSVLAVDAKTGKLAWSFPMRYAPIHGNSPIYKDGFLFAQDGWKVGSYQLKIANDGQSVDSVWGNGLMDLENGDAILIGDNLYGANWDQKGFSCVDWKTGKEKFKNSDLISGSPCYADGLFYWYGINGNVALIKATESSLDIISSFKTPGPPKRDHCSHPVIHDGKLYLRYDTTLWVYDISK